MTKTPSKKIIILTAIIFFTLGIVADCIFIAHEKLYVEELEQNHIVILQELSRCLNK